MSLVVVILLIVSLLTLHLPTACASHGESLVHLVVQSESMHFRFCLDPSIFTVLAVVVLIPNNELMNNRGNEVSENAQSTLIVGFVLFTEQVKSSTSNLLTDSSTCTYFTKVTRGFG